MTRVLLWEEGDSDSVPLASDDCNTPLLTTSPGPVLALAALSAEAKQSNTAANHARLIWQRTEIGDHGLQSSSSDTHQGLGSGLWPGHFHVLSNGFAMGNTENHLNSEKDWVWLTKVFVFLKVLLLRTK